MATNPALGDLESLVGEWEMELSNASFLDDPSESFRGHAAMQWVQEGAYLLMTQGERGSQQFATWLVGRDEAAEIYKVLYFDNRGVSRVYEMSFATGVWKMWRDAPGFHQRFEGTVDQDGERIEAKWEKSSDGQSWEHDFDLTYTRKH